MHAPATVRRQLAAASALLLFAACDDSGSGPLVDSGAPDAMTGVDAGADAGPVVNDPNDSSTWVPPERPVLPPPPAWEPPQLPLGAPGWRDSDEPLCAADSGALVSNHVWADANGVYVWVGILNDPLTGDRSWPSGGQLLFNDGSGWTELFWAPPSTGLGVRGDLIALDSGHALISSHNCGSVAEWDGSKVTCTLPETGPSSLFAVDGSSVRAVAGDSLYSREGSGPWVATHTLPERGPDWRYALWADATTAVVAGPLNYVVTVSPDGVLDRSLEVPAGDYQSVWANALDDIWLGNHAAQLVHYDGETWTTLPTGIDIECSGGIAGLWGHGEDLYFITANAFGRVQGGAIDVIVEVPCGGTAPMFNDIWGNATGTEIYLAVQDDNFVDYQCGTSFVVYYDGTLFHRF